MQRAGIQHRAKALLSLIALACALLHSHGPSHAQQHADEVAGPASDAWLASGSPGDASLSSDDAHHEHSSHSLFRAEACLACRSHGDDEGLPAAPPQIWLVDPCATPTTSIVDSPRLAVHAGLPTPRGPPPAHG